MYTRLYMGDKLYWRTKKNGKWTWTPAVYDLIHGECTHPDGERVVLWWPAREEEE